MAYMRLGDLLVASGTITEQQLERALALQKETKQRLGDVLIQNGFITEAQLIDALRVQLGVDFVDLTAISIPVELAQYVPRNIAKKYCVVPVKLVRNSLYLAMSDPLDFVAQDEVKTASRKRIIPMIATRKAVEQAISRLYGNEGTARVIEEMKREAGSSSDVIPAQMAQDTADPQESAPTIRFVNALIERAYTERASDIHLEPQEGEMVVRMRIDGLLRRILTVPADLQNTVISRLKIMGGMNIAEHKIPQDATPSSRCGATVWTCVSPPCPRCMARRWCCVCWTSPLRPSANPSWDWRGRILTTTTLCCETPAASFCWWVPQAPVSPPPCAT